MLASFRIYIREKKVIRNVCIRQLKLAFICILLSVCPIVAADFPLRTADNLWKKRDAVYSEATKLADPLVINEAISYYQKAIVDNSDQIRHDATWRLLRAYCFKGTYTTNDPKLKIKIFSEGKRFAEEALRKYPNSAEINVFYAVIVGSWSEKISIISAALDGAADKIRRSCKKSIAINKEFEDALALRVLGRLHYKAPKIPFILSWPSLDKSIYYLEESLRIAPRNPFTKLFLGQALYKKGEKQKAIALLNEICSANEIILGKAEDDTVRQEAKQYLSQWK